MVYAPKQRLFYAQSGGMTSVINASAYGVIREARRLGIEVYAGRNGILGAIEGALFDTTQEIDSELELLPFTPGGIFGSCRCCLPDPVLDLGEYRKIFAVFKKHRIGYLLYNGGNDSQDSIHKLYRASQLLNYPLYCVGIPKTVDNDVLGTDSCPGFGSTAKYIASVTREVDLDLQAMSVSSTKVLILEVMGRHTGWIAAASGLARQNPGEAPHLILVPEIPVHIEQFLEQVQQNVKQYARCFVVVAEGVKDNQGNHINALNKQDRDQFGHLRLGGVAPFLATIVKNKLGYKPHWITAGYLQRSARHLASQTDLNHAIQLGEEAVHQAVIYQRTNCMVSLFRTSDYPYQYTINTVPLVSVANKERMLPLEYLEDYSLTAAGITYFTPLIQGETSVRFENGLPRFARFKNQLV